MYHFQRDSQITKKLLFYCIPGKTTVPTILDVAIKGTLVNKLSGVVLLDTVEGVVCEFYRIRDNFSFCINIVVVAVSLYKTYMDDGYD